MTQRGFRGRNLSHSLGRVSVSFLPPTSAVDFPCLLTLFFEGSELLWGTTPPFYPNSIVYLAAFISLCENFLGCRPHWGLFKHIFTCRSQTVKKANPSDERTQVIQMCGGLGIQTRGKSSFPAMILPDSVRGWQST